MKPIMCDSIDVFDPLKNKMDLIIEYFVDFYGEADREFITKRLKEDTTYFFLPKTGNAEYDTLSNLWKYYEGKVEEVFVELDKKFNVDLSCSSEKRVKPNKMQKIKKKLLDGEKLDHTEYLFIEKFAEEFKIPLKLKLFKVDEFNRKTVLKLAEKIDEYCNVYKDEYGLKVSIILADEIEAQNALTSMMPDVKVLENLADNRIQEKALDCFSSLLKSMGIDLDVDAHKTYFQTYLELAKIGRLLPFATDKQEKEYVELFKFLGIDFGDNYSDYYAKFGTFKDKVIDKNLRLFIGRQYSELQQKKQAENIFLVDAIEKVKSLGMYYSKDTDDAIMLLENYVYSNPKTGAFICAYKDQNNELKYMCIFSDYFSLSTGCVIHEINHLLETVFLGEDNECYYTKSGFDIVPHAKSDKARIDFSNFIRGEHRAYESFSEIVNEYIAYKIYSKMQEDGVCLGGNNGKTSYYKFGFCAFYKFIEENLDVIIDGRRSTDQYKLADYISPEEYEELAEMAEEILHASFFDIKSATSEILIKAKKPLSNEIELAKLLRTSRLFDRVKWSDNVKLLYQYTKKIDLIADTLKESSSSLGLDSSIMIKKIAEEEKTK